MVNDRFRKGHLKANFFFITGTRYSPSIMWYVMTMNDVIYAVNGPISAAVLSNIFRGIAQGIYVIIQPESIHSTLKHKKYTFPHRVCYFTYKAKRALPFFRSTERAKGDCKDMYEIIGK